MVRAVEAGGKALRFAANAAAPEFSQRTLSRTYLPARGGKATPGIFFWNFLRLVDKRTARVEVLAYRHAP